ncbi:MAG TPA: hypothetical protein DCQ50_10100 [Chryseobacterium sp.]|nr:hypothetical protein [Chryseobacterium sp.]
MEAICISCNEPISPKALFCQHCGTQQKCKLCETPIVNNAKYCIGGGVSLFIAHETKSNEAVNTIKFNQTKDSRSYEVAFTDNVASGVVDVIRNMTAEHPQIQFQELPSSDLGKGDGKKVQLQNDVVEDLIEEEDQQAKDNSEERHEVPHINDIENTLECSEQHWILIYAYYISDKGKNTFSKDDLLKRYKDKRATPSRISNFSAKWKNLFNGFVKTIKTDEFKLTDKGVNTVLDLINGKLKSEAAKTLPGKTKKEKAEEKENPATKKKSKTPAKAIQIEEFDLGKGSKKPSLSDFLKDGKAGENTSNRILAIAYYIVTFCDTKAFSEGNIEYAYKVLKLNNRPVHLYQIIVNAKNKNVWYEKDKATNRWKLARAGELFYEENLSKN